jgi:heme exporter protein D
MPFWAGLTTSFFSLVGFLISRQKGPEPRGRSLWGPLWFKSFIVLLAMAGYAFFLPYLGFLICTFIFMLILLRIIEPHKWKVVVGVALATGMISYLVFNVFLKTQLPMGILRRYLVF